MRRRRAFRELPFQPVGSINAHHLISASQPTCQNVPGHRRHRGRTATANGHLRLATGLISRLTGVQRVHVRPRAGRRRSGSRCGAEAIDEQPGDIDLLMFASASQDLIEPATSHIVSAKLGLSAPVFDVKNACNSVINALQIADALIRAGSHRRILVVSGEAPTSAVRWQLRDRAQFVRSFPGYSMSDGGAAVLLEADESCQRGIQAATFHALSRHWNIGTLPGGVAAHDPDMTYFDMDGSSLQRAFLELGPEPITTFLRQQRRRPTDFDFVAIHQVSVPFLPPILGVWECPPTGPSSLSRTTATSPRSPSLQLELARRRGMIGPGSLVLLIGLAGESASA